MAIGILPIGRTLKDLLFQLISPLTLRARQRAGILYSTSQLAVRFLHFKFSCGIQTKTATADDKQTP